MKNPPQTADAVADLLAVARDLSLNPVTVVAKASRGGTDSVHGFGQSEPYQPVVRALECRLRGGKVKPAVEAD